MFGKRKASAPAAATTSDQYTVKATGECVTVLRDLSGGEVKVARDRDGVSREAIVRKSEIRPA